MALLRLVKVLLLAGLKFDEVEMLMMMGRWSEFKAVSVVQDVEVRREEETMEISGDVALPVVGIRVGVLRLREAKLELLIVEAM